MRRIDPVLQLLAPLTLVGVAALVGTLVSTSTETYVINALVNVAIVVALYVFIGNSGVLSFGHISFVAVGAWTAGVLSMPVAEKPAIMPHLFAVLGNHTVGNLWSLAIAAAVGAAYALVAGLPLMRLSGLAAGIATFGVLEITHNVLRYWDKIGPGSAPSPRSPRPPACCRLDLEPVSPSSLPSRTSAAGSAGSSAQRARTRPRLARSGCPCIASG